jgi:hypothetical protein
VILSVRCPECGIGRPSQSEKRTNLHSFHTAVPAEGSVIIVTHHDLTETIRLRIARQRSRQDRECSTEFECLSWVNLGVDSKRSHNMSRWPALRVGESFGARAGERSPPETFEVGTVTTDELWTKVVHEAHNWATVAKEFVRWRRSECRM